MAKASNSKEVLYEKSLHLIKQVEDKVLEVEHNMHVRSVNQSELELHVATYLLFNTVTARAFNSFSI